jgi:hypothetical protein
MIRAFIKMALIVDFSEMGFMLMIKKILVDIHFHHGVEICQDDGLMKQAEQSVADRFGPGSYRFMWHNCHHYRKAVNEKYGELIKQNGGICMHNIQNNMHVNGMHMRIH